MGEAIKHTLIRDRSLFETLLCGAQINEDIICRNIDIKRDVVQRDELETGERMLLNFGHTLGHAIEKLYNFETYTHGEAVAMGMVLITKASEKHGLTQKGTTEQIKELLKKFNLPTSCPATISDIIKSVFLNDKKHDGKGLTIVLLRSVGDAYLHRLTDTEFSDFLSGDLS